MYKAMIKEIKSWFTKRPDGSGTTLNVSVELVEAYLAYESMGRVRDEIVSRVADKFIEENKEALIKDVLGNKKFADAVYNAIVLKKSSELLK